MTPGLKRWRRSLARAPLTWAKRSGLGCHSHRFILYANRRNSKGTPTTSAGAAVNAYNENYPSHEIAPVLDHDRPSPRYSSSSYSSVSLVAASILSKGTSSPESPAFTHASLMRSLAASWASKAAGSEREPVSKEASSRSKVAM